MGQGEKTSAPPPVVSREIAAFFRQWGHCHLCAIPAEGGRARGKHCTKLSHISEFLASGGDNFYFSVNPPAQPLDKKLKKEDIAEVRWIHADLDPDPNKQLEAERARLMRLTLHTPQEMPPPHVVIDSGNGYQIFWRLSEPVGKDIGEELCRFVGKAFGADDCWNCDRVMRVPGTMNIPSARKRALGRVPTPASLVRADWEARVGADDLTVAAVPESVRKLARGEGDYPSRSERVFAFCGAAQRAGMPIPLLRRVLTNRDYTISASILEKRNPAQYADRQITRSTPTSSNTTVEAMNQQYAVIEDAGGRCRVLLDDDGNKASYLSFEDVVKIYQNVAVEGTTLGKFWLMHPERRQYKRVVFDPALPSGAATDRGIPVFNRWQGFAHEPRDGSLHQSFLDHLHDNVCCRDSDCYVYLWQWICRMLQHPELPAETAIVLQGTTGIGKTFVAETLSALLGRHSIIISNSEHLVGRFNYHLGEVVLLVGEEAFFAGDKRHEGALKTLITGKTLPVERKGFDLENQRNRLHILLTSNEDWVVPVGVADRRFAVFQVGDEKRRDRDYFQKITEDLEAGGYGNLLAAALSVDLGDYNPLAIPVTDARYKQFERTLDPDRRWWADILEAGGMPSAIKHEDSFDGRPQDKEDSQEITWHSRPRLRELHDHYLLVTSTARRTRLLMYGDWRSRWAESLPGGVFSPPLDLEECRQAFWRFVRGEQ